MRRFQMRFMSIVIGFLAYMPFPSYAMCNPDFALESYVQGRDTVVYSIDDNIRNADLYEQKPAPETIDKAVKEPLQARFSKYPGLKLLDGSGYKIDHYLQPNIIGLSIELTAREESTSKGKIAVVSVAATLSRLHSISLEDFNIQQDHYKLPETYPFVWPDNKEGFNLKISQAVTYLAYEVPGYLDCSNGKRPCSFEFRDGCNDTPSPPVDSK